MTTIAIYEALDYLADRFIDMNLARLLDITFQQYLARPDIYEAQAEALTNGDGINIVAARARIVNLDAHAT